MLRRATMSGRKTKILSSAMSKPKAITEIRSLARSHTRTAIKAVITVIVTGFVGAVLLGVKVVLGK